MGEYLFKHLTLVRQTLLKLLHHVCGYPQEVTGAEAEGFLQKRLDRTADQCLLQGAVEF